MNVCSSSACGELPVNPKRDLKMQALVKTKESVKTNNIDFIIRYLFLYLLLNNYNFFILIKFI